MVVFVIISSNTFVSADSEITINWPIASIPKGANSAAFAVPRNDWMECFARNCKRVKKGQIDLLFQGDSITAGWNYSSSGMPVWKERYCSFNAATFGIGGDRTENVLWRIQNGELDGLSPKLIVLMIGTNNHWNTPAQVADGIKEIVHEMRKRCPNTHILLLGIFPRGEKVSDPLRARIKSINKLISTLGINNKAVSYLDIGKAFMSEDGTLTKEIMPDFLHLSTKGYRIWADQIQGIIEKHLSLKK